MAPSVLTVNGHVATITLAPTGGRIDRADCDALSTACAMVAGDTGRIRAVVVTGGLDFGLGWSAEVLAEAALPEGLLAPPGAAFDALAAVPQPTVAAIEGRAHSAGLELALACDIRVAGEGTSCAMPDTAQGMVPRGGGTQRLPRAVGRAQALRLLLTGEEIDAAEALRIGLVSRVVPSGEVAQDAAALAATIAERGPLATRFAKEAVHRGTELPLQQALRYELDLTVILQSTADRAEGVAAFVERRPPHFTGR